MIDWLWCNVLWKIFHTFQDKNDWPIKQILLCTSQTQPTGSLFVPAHRSNSPEVGMPPNSGTLFWLQANQSSLWSLNIMRLVKKQWLPFKSLWCGSARDQTPCPSTLEDSTLSQEAKTTEAVKLNKEKKGYSSNFEI